MGFLVSSRSVRLQKADGVAREGQLERVNPNADLPPAARAFLRRARLFVACGGDLEATLVAERVLETGLRLNRRRR